jgi:hypothetical protein
VDAGVAVQRFTSDGKISLLFQARDLVGIHSAGDTLYYATATHLGGFTAPSSP